MQVILGIKQRSHLGPIVVVCYTNHALNQFLEHLLQAGISKIIRVGGRSNSERLQNHNLRNIMKTESRTKHEGWQLATAYQQLREYESSSERTLSQLHGIGSRLEWKYFKHYLARRHSRIYVQFRSVDDDGFEMVGRHPFDIWADTGSSNDHSSAPVTVPEVELLSTLRKAERSVQSLSSAERCLLINQWVQELRQDAAENFFETIKDAEDAHRKIASVHEEVNRRLLQGADVIGITTSGLAKNLSTLQHVRSKVVLCEEAGEIMEPHILCALLPNVEHFIQIGDHQQLRPSINNFRDLSLESSPGQLYQLDRSQFERLSIGQPGRPPLPVAQLNVQRRMRPEISELIRESMYSKLVDHHSTTQLPDVIGMRHNVFWLDHENLEEGNPGEVHHKKSKSTDWEVGMVHALVRHVVRQGVYGSREIAVLTPYTGQLQKLRAAMRNDFEIVVSDRDQDALIKDGFSTEEPAQDNTIQEVQVKRKPLEKKKLSDLLRVATVDNFQGEEAKIIIISLVRSNKDRKVGFLRTENRINVLLSRAQHGMYIVGNTDTYSNIPMWQKIINLLRAKDHVGRSLELRSPRHEDTRIHVQQPDDFANFSPEGGCREACMDRLPDCGHGCQARCHSRAMHEVFKCEQPCQRQHPTCGHACQKPTCGEACGRCEIVLNSVALPCGHFKDNVHCYRTQNLQAIRCEAIVSKTVPSCGHTVNVQCSQELDDR